MTIAKTEIYEGCVTTAKRGATYVEGPSTLYTQLYDFPQGSIEKIGVVGNHAIEIEKDGWKNEIRLRTSTSAAIMMRRKDGQRAEYLAKSGNWAEMPEGKEEPPEDAIQIIP